MRYRLGVLLVAVVVLAGCADPGGSRMQAPNQRGDVMGREADRLPDIRVGMREEDLREVLRKEGWSGPLMFFPYAVEMVNGKKTRGGAITAYEEVSSNRGLIVETTHDANEIIVVRRFVFAERLPQSKKDKSHFEELVKLLESSGQ